MAIVNSFSNEGLLNYQFLRTAWSASFLPYSLAMEPEC